MTHTHDTFRDPDTLRADAAAVRSFERSRVVGRPRPTVHTFVLADLTTGRRVRVRGFSASDALQQAAAVAPSHAFAIV